MTATFRLQPNHTLDQFQRYLVVGNRSPNTICIYRYAVEQLYRLYPQLTPRSLQPYKMYLLEHYKSQTVNLRIQVLNCFMEYRQTPIAPISVIKIQQKIYLDKIISQGDYEYLKRRLVENEEYTYYFIMRLITATGVRVSELITFQTEDIHKGHKDICSKGNKMRRIYIPTILKGEFQQWFLAACHTVDLLLLDRFGSPISPFDIRSQFKVFATRYGLDPEAIYSHSFRHRFVKNFIEKYGDIPLLSDLSGHESTRTIRIYFRRSSSERYRIVNKVVDW